MSIKTFSEMISFRSFEERFRYLQLGGRVGAETFGFERYLNQVFYRSTRWKKIRDKVILRDGACDLAIPDRQIYGKILIHHINPISKMDIELETDFLIDPEFLICTTPETHNAIHYGDESLLIKEPIARFRNDTCPWRRNE